MALKFSVGVDIPDRRFDNDHDGDGLSDGWVENGSPGDLTFSMATRMGIDKELTAKGAYPYGTGVSQKIVLAAGGGDNNNTGRYIESYPTRSGVLFNAALNSLARSHIVCATYYWDSPASDTWTLYFDFYSAGGAFLGSSISKAFSTQDQWVSECASVLNTAIPSGAVYVKARIMVSQQRAAGAQTLYIDQIGLGCSIRSMSIPYDAITEEYRHEGSDWHQETFVEETFAAAAAVTRGWDPTGGQIRWAMRLPYRGMSGDDHRILNDYYRTNRGFPSVAAAALATGTGALWQTGIKYPLIVDFSGFHSGTPMREGPGWMYADFVGNKFPLTPDNTWFGRTYQGVLDLREV